MTFRRAILPITPAQQAMQDECRAHGCIACHKLRVNPFARGVEIHHMKRQGMILGEEYVLALCALHHRGIIVIGGDQSLGPYVDESKAFADAFGTPQETLDYQRDLIRWKRVTLPDRAQRKRQGSTKTPSKIIRRAV